MAALMQLLLQILNGIFSESYRQFCDFAGIVGCRTASRARIPRLEKKYLLFYGWSFGSTQRKKKRNEKAMKKLRSHFITYLNEVKPLRTKDSTKNGLPFK